MGCLTFGLPKTAKSKNLEILNLEPCRGKTSWEVPNFPVEEIPAGIMGIRSHVYFKAGEVNITTKLLFVAGDMYTSIEAVLKREIKVYSKNSTFSSSDKLR